MKPLASVKTDDKAMYSALQKLGLQPYHMAEAIKDPVRDLNIACEAVAANCLGEGKPFGRDEFDKWIGDFDVSLCLASFPSIQSRACWSVFSTPSDCHYSGHL